jgi:glutathione synthase/RimK-type ligase-like ATP-grasp enzyme
MILFFGYGNDSSLARAIQAAQQMGMEHCLVDQQALDGCDLRLRGSRADGTGVLTRPGSRVPLADFGSAYARPLAPVAETGTTAHQREAEILSTMVTWLDIAEARIVNRPRDMHSNGSKPYQAQTIAAAGFEVPESLISTDPDEVRAFGERVGPLVFKSISGIRSIVRRLDDGFVSRLERVRALPTQFQALVEGDDVRVHVVGEEVFATRIRSLATDYRYAGRDGVDTELTATDLPDEVAQRCVDLAAGLGLPFVGIDLRETHDGRFVCFEANPMPGYSYFESHTGQPISEALVRFLAGKVTVPGSHPAPVPSERGEAG